MNASAKIETDQRDYQHIWLNLHAQKILGSVPQGNVVGFMSRSEGEGVSTTVAGLGEAINVNEPGSVLIVDANISGNRIADYLQTSSRDIPVEALDSGNLNLQETIGADSGSAVNLLTLQGNAQGRVMVGPGWNDAWLKLKQAHSTILVDMGSWSTASPLFWTDQLDHLLLVIDGNITTREKLANFKSTLDHCGCELQGLIMNQHARPIPDWLYRMIA